MTNSRLALVVMAVAVAMCTGGLVAAAQHASSPAKVLGVNVQKEPAANGKRFAITGQSNGLFPGSTTPLPLVVRNDNNFSVQVTSLDVVARDASPSCPARHLRIERFTGTLTVPAKSSASTTLRIGLEPAAPDACKNASFELTYSGSAVKP